MRHVLDVDHFLNKMSSFDKNGDTRLSKSFIL